MAKLPNILDTMKKQSSLSFLCKGPALAFPKLISQLNMINFLLVFWSSLGVGVSVFSVPDM